MNKLWVLPPSRVLTVKDQWRNHWSCPIAALSGLLCCWCPECECFSHWFPTSQRLCYYCFACHTWTIVFSMLLSPPTCEISRERYYMCLCDNTWILAPVLVFHWWQPVVTWDPNSSHIKYWIILSWISVDMGHFHVLTHKSSSQTWALYQQRNYSLCYSFPAMKLCSQTILMPPNLSWDNLSSVAFSFLVLSI